MTVRYARAASIVGVIVLALVWTVHVVSGQGSQGARSQAVAIAAGRPAASFAGLTAADYIEIRQLVARYAYAVDTGADNGNVYASLFAPDGAFADRMGRETKGKEALAALARRNTRGPQSAFHREPRHRADERGRRRQGGPPPVADRRRRAAERYLRRRTLRGHLHQDSRRVEVQAP